MEEKEEKGYRKSNVTFSVARSKTRSGSLYETHFKNLYKMSNFYLKTEQLPKRD
jgi:hypothetical protein